SPRRTSGEPASPIARRCATAPPTPGRSMRTRSSTGSSSIRSTPPTELDRSPLLGPGAALSLFGVHERLEVRVQLRAAGFGGHIAADRRGGERLEPRIARVLRRASGLLEGVDVELEVLVLVVERHARGVADAGGREFGRVAQRDARLDPERRLAAVGRDVEDV